MGRQTRQNNLTDAASIAAIHPENKQLLNDFLDYLRSVQRSESTINVYKNDLEIAFVWALKHIDNTPFPRWTKRHIMQFQNWLIYDNGNSPARVRRIKATLSSLSNFIENILDDEYGDFRNIVHKVESPPAAAVRQKTVLTDEQLQELLKKLTDDKQYEKACMVALAAYSARRKSELVRYKVSYFDEKNIIYGSLYKTPEPVRTKGRGKGKYIYLYTLVKDFKPYLDAWLEERKRRGIESEWLFPAPDDPRKHLNAQTLNGWAASFSKILGVDFYWHCLRHFYTSSMSQLGLPDSIIQGLVGWTSADMVRLYDDTPADEQFGKYFSDGEIVAQDKPTLADL